MSFSSSQIWQHLLDLRAPETTAISYSETIHTWRAIAFLLGFRSWEVCNHMPWTWIMGHIPNKLNGFWAYCLHCVEMNKNYTLLGLFHLETQRWKFGCFKAMNFTKFNLSTVLRPDYGWVSKSKGNFKGTSIFDKFSEATIWKWCLWPKNSSVIAQKIAPVIHNQCWHHLVDHWSVSSSLRLRNPMAMSPSTRSISSHVQFPSWKMLSVAGVRYHTKLYVETAAGRKLALAMILLA